jgi:hypothetical protein
MGLVNRQMGLNAMDHENLQRELRARFPSHPVPKLPLTDEPGNPVAPWLALNPLKGRLSEEF